MSHKIYCSMVLILFASCSPSNFNGSNNVKRNVKNQPAANHPSGEDSSDGTKDGSDKDGTDTDGTDTDKDGSSTTQTKPDQFATKNKSLDAYLLVDTSGSLEFSDRECKRYEAVYSFKNALNTFLGASGDARVTLILFSNSARFHSTTNDFLKLSDSDFSNRYRSALCEHSGNTNASDGFKLVLSKSDEVMGSGKKDVASVLFFTDGLPTEDKDNTLSNADQLKAKFNSRIFSVYLDGSANGSTFPLPSAFSLPPEEFLKYVSGSSNRVRKVSDPSGLGASMTSFLGQ